MLYLIVIGVTLIALAFILRNYFALRKMEEGTEEMSKLAGTIRSGSRTFMRTEYKLIVPTIIIVALIFSLFIEASSGITFILGAAMSSIVCILGMNSASYANVRTTNTARLTKSIGATTKTAMLGGSISGLSVHAFGLIGLCAILLAEYIAPCDGESTGLILHKISCNPFTMRLTTYSLGCSLVALFNRVAGGNYTKAADIGADFVGKIVNDLPEDDHRNPATIADFVGDMINDIAGNCSDLLESFVATIIAAILISRTSFSGTESAFLQATTSFPIILAGLGLIGSVIGVAYVLIHKASDDPSKELDIATYISAASVLIFGGLASWYVFGNIELNESFTCGWASPWLASILGIASGVAVGKITEHYTGLNGNPIKKLAAMAKEGIAFLVTKGDALGSRSALLPVLIICGSIIASGLLCGVYGIAIAALGMLSFVGTTVTIDAFGPIADNAGGIAESLHLPAEVRKITDMLDAVGNTTAAIGKGFAIGSAAFATVSLTIAYVGTYSVGKAVLNLANYAITAGAILGGTLIEFFSAVLTDNTIDAATQMADETAKQLKRPGVLEGEVEPDYDACIEIAAQNALHKMLPPSLLALLIPAFGGILFGAEFVGGILIGATIVAIPKAIFMGNSGGAFDNCKKYIEAGMLEGCKKGDEVHKTAVAGDTIGDTRKDVVGVALDIFIKLMSTVANTLAPVFVNFHLFG